MTDRESYDNYMALRRLVQEAGGEPGPWRDFGNWAGLNEDMRLHLIKGLADQLNARLRRNTPADLEDHW